MVSSAGPANGLKPESESGFESVSSQPRNSTLSREEKRERDCEVEMRRFQAVCRGRRQVSETPGSAFGFNKVFN